MKAILRRFRRWRMRRQLYVLQGHIISALVARMGGTVQLSRKQIIDSPEVAIGPGASRDWIRLSVLADGEPPLRGDILDAMIECKEAENV